MSTPSADVMDALLSLDMGEDVTLTVTRDGEEQSISAHVTGVFREEPGREAGIPVPGELDIHMDATNESVTGLDLPSHSLAIYARDIRPGRWRTVEFTVWEPVMSDEDETLIVGDEYRDLGVITDVKRGRGDERSE